MTIRLDKISHDRGFRDGKENQTSLFQQELISTGFDELSYLSGFIAGKDREIIPSSGGVAKDEPAGWERKGRGWHDDIRKIA